MKKKTKIFHTNFDNVKSSAFYFEITKEAEIFISLVIEENRKKHFVFLVNVFLLRDWSVILGNNIFLFLIPDNPF